MCISSFVLLQVETDAKNAIKNPITVAKMKAASKAENLAAIAANPVRAALLWSAAECTVRIDYCFEEKRYPELGGLTLEEALGVAPIIVKTN